MIKEIRIEKAEDILSTLACIEDFSQSKSERTSYYIFKGVPAEENTLQTSLEKNYGSRKRGLEKNVLRNFAKYASINENPYLFDSEWSQMIIGEHYGLPSRMLDWSRSALVALHFALSEDSYLSFHEKDCVLWAMDIKETNCLLPRKYRKRLQDAIAFTTDMLKNTDLDKYDKDMGDESFIVLEPPSIDQGIVNRYSFYSVMPAGIENFEKYLDKKTINTKKIIIDKSIKWKVRDTLDTMNINERILNPGYDGLCSWLKRHYFNRTVYSEDKE